MEAFCASWKLVASDNVHEYMKTLGIEDEIIHIANVVKPVITISQEGDDVVVKNVTSISSKEISFKLNEEFDETTLDGRNCKSIVSLDGDKLVQLQKWDDKESTATREIKDGQMVMTLEHEGAVAVCTYDRV